MRCHTLFFLAILALVAASPSTTTPTFYKGHDLSSLRIFEEAGVQYKDTLLGNITRPAEDILGDGGMNTVRLRLWVDPTRGDQYGTSPGDYGINYTLPLAKQMYDKGYKIYLDFHFSNYWADPTKQTIPPAWPTELKPLSTTLRTYVSSTLETFHNAGVELSIVSLGNEIRNGILWPNGEVDVNISPAFERTANFTNLAKLWASARQGVTDAVHAGVPKPLVMIHIDDGWNVTLQQDWFGALTGSGHVQDSDWDIFGFSFYPFYGLAATLANLKTSLTTFANQYGKPIHIAETDWPESCPEVAEGDLVLSDKKVPISAKGQTEWMRDIGKVLADVPYGLGQGLHYWEPAWINNTGLGSACDDAILFNTDWSDYPNVTTYSRTSVNMFAEGFPV